MMNHNEQRPGILPDHPDYVHGVKAKLPGRGQFRIQCDGCGRIDDGSPVQSDIRFTGYKFGDQRRMCRPCWLDAGLIVDPFGYASGWRE